MQELNKRMTTQNRQLSNATNVIVEFSSWSPTYYNTVFILAHPTLLAATYVIHYINYLIVRDNGIPFM